MLQDDHYSIINLFDEIHISSKQIYAGFLDVAGATQEFQCSTQARNWLTYNQHPTQEAKGTVRRSNPSTKSRVQSRHCKVLIIARLPLIGIFLDEG